MPGRPPVAEDALRSAMLAGGGGDWRKDEGEPATEPAMEPGAEVGTAECLCEGDEPGVLEEACLRAATLASRRTCSRWRLSSRCWVLRMMLW